MHKSKYHKLETKCVLLWLLYVLLAAIIAPEYIMLAVYGPFVVVAVLGALALLFVLLVIKLGLPGFGG